MTETNGIAAMAEIKKNHPDTEVLIITAYASLETAQPHIMLEPNSRFWKE